MATKMTDEEKAKRKALKESPEGIREQLAKLKENEAKMIADLAVKENPELEASITTVSSFIREVQKNDEALKMGADVNVEKQRAGLRNQIEFYQKKIEGIKAQLDSSDADTVLSQLRDGRTKAIANLADAVKTVAPDMAKHGTSVESLIPTILPFLDEINAIIKA